MSIYPTGIDGYAQIPLVMDNVTRIDAVTVNRLRDAIVNIETELGITPSGASADVSSRLSSIESLIVPSTLQIAYNAGNSISLTDTEGNFSITTDSTGTTAEFVLTSVTGNFLSTDSTNNKILLGSAAIATDIKSASVTSSANPTWNFGTGSATFNGGATFSGGASITGGNLSLAVGTTLSVLGATNFANGLSVTSGSLSLSGSTSLSMGTGTISFPGVLSLSSSNISLTGIPLTWSSSFTPTLIGQLGMNATNGRPLAFIDGAARTLAHTDELSTYATHNISFSAVGIYTTYTGLGGPWYNRNNRALTINNVTFWRKKAGTSSSTTIDVLVNGVSIWNASAKPYLSYTEGDDVAREVIVFDSTSVPAAAKITVNILGVDGGSPEDLIVYVNMNG